MWTYYYYKGQATTYQVSETGQVKNMKTGNILKGTKDKDGYIKIHITKPEDKVLFLHQMIAETFIVNDNPEKKKCVNHKDGNKENNSIGNLEWCTDLENAHHAWENGLIDTGKHVFCYDKDKNFLGEFISISATARALNVDPRTVQLAIRNNPPLKTVGYYFLPERNDDFIPGIKERQSHNNTKSKKPVMKCDLNGNSIESYESIKEAANLNHISKRTVSDCCNGRRKSGKGFTWKFI